MDFEHAKTPSYMDSMDNSAFSYMDNGLDYLQYPASPSFGVAMGLPGPSASPSIGFNTLNLLSGSGDYTYSSSPASFNPSSPARPYTPEDGASIAPPLSYNLSGGDLSSDSGRRSRGSGSPSPPQTISYAATVPRSHRFNPIAAPATRSSTRAAHRRRASRSNDDSDEDDEDFPATINMSAGGADSRRETIRKQRIESEQRRRDELRDGYARLKDTLPASNQKSSKVSLLDRATSHLRYLETVKDQLENRLKSAETEVHRLRNVNEALMLGTANQRHTAGVTTLVPTSAF
jgi:hypothetical protein